MENKYYYNKYYKYKNKYLSLKKYSNNQQGGAHTQSQGQTHPNSIAGQLLEVINVIRGTFIPNNSRMFQSTYYFNDQRCLELSIYKINGLKHEASKYQNDASYSAKMSMLNYAIETIHRFFNCVKTKFSEHQILYSVNHKIKQNFKSIMEIPVNNLEFVLSLFQHHGINPHNFMCQNNFLAAKAGPGTGGPIGCTNPNAINYNPIAMQDDGSCKYSGNYITGCTDRNAINYNPNAMQNDGSCKYPSNAPYVPTGPTAPYVPTGPTAQYVPTGPTAPYVPNAPYVPYVSTGPTAPYVPTYPGVSYTTPIIFNSEKDDSSSDSLDESPSEEPITKIEIQPIKGKKIIFTKNGTFELKEGKSKNKDIKFKLEIHIDDEKSYFIETVIKKKKYVNIFYDKDEKSKDDSKEIKSIAIEDRDNKVKINYNIKPIKKLLQKIEKIIKKVSG